MKGSANYVIGSIAALLLAVWMVACTSVQEQPKPAAPAVAQQPAPSYQERKEPSKQESSQDGDKSGQNESRRGGRCDQQRRPAHHHFSSLNEKGKSEKKLWVLMTRLISKRMDNRVKLRELQETDKALINYEPDAYTPANSVKVVGKGKIQKVGGDD